MSVDGPPRQQVAPAAPLTDLTRVDDDVPMDPCLRRRSVEPLEGIERIGGGGPARFHFHGDEVRATVDDEVDLVTLAVSIEGEVRRLAAMQRDGAE